MKQRVPTSTQPTNQIIFHFRKSIVSANMVTNQVEYFILYSVIECLETLKNVASDCKFSHAEVAIAANRLFQNGDILALFPTDSGENVISNVVLTISQIKAHLDGKLSAFYYLTPQGGARWEALSNPDWNRFYKWRSYLNKESEIICADQQIIENLLIVSYLNGQILLPETKIWDVLEPWQATYWKTLPKAYRLRYQFKNYDSSTVSSSYREWIEADKQAKRLDSEILQWYTEPELDTNPSNLFENTDFHSYAIPPENPNPKVEYLILNMAVIFNCYSLRNVAYSEKLSHVETAVAAHSLFQRGDIRARVFVDEYDFDGIPDIILTMPGILDHLDGRLSISYYLTPQGGERWEAMTCPDWNKFLIVNFLSMFPYEEGILGTQRENLEKILALDKFILMHQHIPGTEVWEVLEPWQATYWKTLPRGYYVRCEYKSNDLRWDLEDTPIEIVEEYEQALQWYENIREWYTNPEFD